MEPQALVATLNALIENCKDGEYGFEACAGQVRSEELRRLFAARAADCRRSAQELQSLVVQYGGAPDMGGSRLGALHRGWVAVRGALAGHGDEAMLEECESGEGAAVERYRNALSRALPAEVRAVIERQFEGARRNHAQIRAELERRRAASA